MVLKNIIITFMLMSMFVLANAFPRRSSKTKKIYYQIKTAFQNKQYSKAKRLIRRSKLLNRKHVKTMLIYYSILRKEKKYKSALFLNINILKSRSLPRKMRKKLYAEKIYLQKLVHKQNRVANLTPKYKENITERIYTTNDFAFNFGIYSWRENFAFKSDNSTVKFNSSIYVPCLGASYSFKIGINLIHLGACYFQNKINISSEDNPSIGQENVDFNGVISNLSYLIHKQNEFSYGLELPFLFSQGDYDEIGGYEIEGKTKSVFGLNIISRWHLNDKFHMSVKMGKMANLEDLFMGINFELL